MTVSKPKPATRGRRVLRGLPASPGVARGRWSRIERQRLPDARTIRADEADVEITRLRAAADAVAQASTALAQRVRDAGHEAEAAIFSAHAAMAEDPELLNDAGRRIRAEALDAIGAISAAGRAVADQLGAIDDELLRSRAADVLDVANNIARHLAGLGPASATLREPTVVVARDLAPSMTATLPRERLLAIALEASSPTAHAAILARAYGIPSIVGVPDLLAVLDAAGAEAEVLVDGSTGEIIVDPDEADRERFAREEAEVRAGRTRDEAEAALPVVTRDGVTVTLLANIGSPGETGSAVRLGAHGVGLFRTEFLFLERSNPPSEKEQVEAYSAAAAALAPFPVTIRLLDVGGDKRIPYLQLAPEENPFLGVRALRLADVRPDLFLTQLRACYRAGAHGEVKVMAPMVADDRDVTAFLDLAAGARRDVIADGYAIGEVGLGVMLEIPSAILVASTYFARLQFASLGTNDLLQYTLAVDRGNARLERYRDPFHPAVLRLVHMAVAAAVRAGIDLSVCGEMAGDPLAAVALVGLGIRSLSLAPSNIPAVRRAIREVDLEHAQAAAIAALGDSSAADARTRFASLTR